MSLPTFYLDEGFIEGSQVALSGKEAWHALGVRRLNVGDSIRIIDGKGVIAEVEVESLEGRNHALLRVVEVIQLAPQQPDIILATAIAKGDRQGTLLDMATQLGISAWQPLLCHRSVSKVGKNSYERWQRIILEACKQSGSAWLPELLPAAKPEDAALKAAADGREVLLAHPDGVGIESSSDAGKLIMIGPEGGFTDDEVRRIVAAGATKISLGQQILRIETAAVSMLARLRIT